MPPIIESTTSINTCSNSSENDHAINNKAIHTGITITGTNKVNNDHDEKYYKACSNTNEHDNYDNNHNYDEVSSDAASINTTSDDDNNGSSNSSCCVMMKSNDTCSTSKSIYLTPDERYQIWEVKAAERPELLKLWIKKERNDEEEKDNDIIVLQDGCDIQGWRYYNMMNINNINNNNSNDYIQGILNVGPGCTLLRRESQIPILTSTTNSNRNPSSSSSSSSSWTRLKQELLTRECIGNIHIIDYDDSIIKNNNNNSTNNNHRPWFEIENIPVVIKGCTKTWKAMETCTYKNLLKRFGNCQWRFSDTHGETLTLNTYNKYCNNIDGAITDDTPLGIYDSQLFNIDDERNVISNEYIIPKYFNHEQYDLFHNLQSRPPYRWILIGSERSGTGLHIDPLGTHAWVTLIEGCKRWIFIQQSKMNNNKSIQESEKLLKQLNDNKEQQQIPSSIWFRDYYPKIINNNNDNDYNIIEYIQYPGDTVYVPAGWIHGVINLGDKTQNVAITHNYATEYPTIQQLLYCIKNDNENSSQLLSELKQMLQIKRPDLWEQMKLSSQQYTKT